MLKKAEKIKIVEELKEKLKKEKIVILVNFSKLSVKALNQLRRELKKIDTEFKVIKKSLFQIALNKLNFDGDISQFKVPCAIAISYKDEIEPAKILYKFSKENENLEILGSFLNKKLINEKETIELAKLASRPEQLTMLTRNLASPLIRFVNLRNNLLYKFINILNNYSLAKNNN